MDRSVPRPRRLSPIFDNGNLTALRTRPGATRPTLDPLEARRLLSAAVEAGVLRVTGTEGADVIRVALDAGQYRVSQSGLADVTFANAPVTSIELIGLGGNDRLTVDRTVTVRSVIDGGAGDDTLAGGLGADAFVGGLGLDTADYSARTDDLRLTIAGALDGGLGRNEGDDIRADVETVLGGQGNDEIKGGVGNNRIDGMAGHDTLIGMECNDTLLGNAGNDTVDGKQGADVLSGGVGFDSADYRFETANLVLSIDGVANEAGGGAQGDNIQLDVERIVAGEGSDRVTGSALDNSITGRGGNDTVFGLGGNDSIDGDAGNDSIVGDAGADVLTGGAGADVHVGGDGTDTFITNDGVRDTLVGGLGLDQAVADAIDLATEVETGTNITPPPPPPPPTAPEVTVAQGTVNVADGATTVSFGGATVGQTAPTRTFTVRNDGTATLTLGAVTVPAGFSVVEGLSTSLARGASDTFTIRLNTATAGVKTGQVTFANNDANENPFNFTVTGTVNAVVVPPPAPKYPEVTVALGAVNVADNATAPLSFGSVARGATAPTRTFTVRNAGQANLVLGPVSVPAGFALVEGLTPTLAPGAADTFTVRLDTAVAGNKGGQISFTTNDANETPFNFAVAGTVTAPVVTPPPAPKYPEIAVSLMQGTTAVNVADGATAAIGFGTVAKGSAGATRVFRVQNLGQAALTVGRPVLPVGFTLVEGITPTLAPGAADTFTVRLDTTIAGGKSGQISFVNNDANENPFNFAVGGTVTAPPPVTPPPAPKYAEVTVTMVSNGMNVTDGSTAAINFGAVTRGQAAPTRTFRVKNDGQATLTLGAVTVPAGFTVVDPLTGPLAPGAMESFTIRMDTAVAGAKAGQISFVNNDPNEGPFNFAVAGQVNNPAPTTPPPPPPAPRVTASLSAGGTLTVMGTPGNDSIVMTQSGAGVALTASGTPVAGGPFNGVKKIHVLAGDGNDLVYLTDLNIPAILDGGNGDDTLRAGTQNDALSGAEGADVLEGFIGHDTLRGGAGNDLIIGGPGIDHLYGDDGNDTVQATDGLSDGYVDGGAGTDTIRTDRTDPSTHT